MPFVIHGFNVSIWFFSYLFVSGMFFWGSGKKHKECFESYVYIIIFDLTCFKTCSRIFYLVCFAFEVFNNNELWEMIRDRSGYVSEGTFVLVNKFCCSACYSTKKCCLLQKLCESIIPKNWLVHAVFEYFVKYKLKSPASTLNLFLVWILFKRSSGKSLLHL